MAEFSEGVKIRAQIDGEVVKALILANGGGAVAFLTLLPSLLDDHRTLAVWIVWGLLGFFWGLAFAILHNRFRRHCSLAYDIAWRQGGQPKPERLWGFQLKRPRVCGLSEVFMWLSVTGFGVGGTCGFIGGLVTVYGG